MRGRGIVVVVAVFGSAAASAQPAAMPLTLGEALARARTTAPILAAAGARSTATREASARAGRPLNPIVELRSENWASGAPGGLPLDVFATVTQTVEFGGKRGARRDVAEAAATTAAAIEGMSWRDVAAAVSHDYLAVVRAGDHLAALDAHAARLADAERILARRVEVGTTPELELLRLRAEAARITVERSRIFAAGARAAAVLGARLDLDVGVGQVRRPLSPPLPVEGDLSMTHPEIQVAESHLQAARAAARFEHARRRPDLGVNAGVKRTSGYNTGVVALTLPVPMFDTNAVARIVADGQVRAAELERVAVERRLRGERAATTAVATTLTAKADEVARTLVTPAREARAAVRLAFETGVLDITRLIEAERLVLDADRVAIDLALDAVGATIEARLASGQEALP